MGHPVGDESIKYVTRPVQVKFPGQGAFWNFRTRLQASFENS